MPDPVPATPPPPLKGWRTYLALAATAGLQLAGAADLQTGIGDAAAEIAKGLGLDLGPEAGRIIGTLVGLGLAAYYRRRA